MASDRDQPVDAERRCLECANPIAAGARLCAHCGSHQSRWRNEILFASTLVGIASVTVTAIAFLITIWPQVTSVIAWSDDVEVVEFDGLGAIVIGNRGDGPVYVSDVRADTGPFAFVRLINSVIEPGDLGIFEPDSIFESVRFRYITPNKETRHIPPRDSARSYLDPEGCHTILVVSESSPSYRLWTTRMGDRVAVFDEPAQVVVRYHGIDSGRSYEDTLTVPAVAGLDRECLEGPGAS